MSIQQNFPSTRPSLNLNFARSQKLDPRITFTRTSSATRVNSDGLIEVVPANSPRFDFDPISGESLGLLVEEQRTNLLRWSEEADNPQWNIIDSSITVDPNVTVSPDGSQTADKVKEATTTGAHSIEFTGFAFQSGTIYTVSFYAKAAERSRFRVAWPIIFTNRLVFVDISPGGYGVISDDGTVTSVSPAGNDWFRVVSTSTCTTTTTGARVGITLVDTGTNVNYTGDGTSGIYIWGAQLEVGSFPTSYIPTTTSTVTRTADNASITGSNFSDWYRQDEGTLNLSYRLGQKISDSRALELYNDLTPNQNRISIVSGTAASIGGYLFVVSNGVPQGQGPTVSNIGLENSIFKVSASYKLNDLAATNNRTPTFFTDDIAELPVGVNSLIFSEYTTGRKLCGHIQYFSYYPSRLPNDQLITLTK
jgi:hypothetical protein